MSRRLLAARGSPDRVRIFDRPLPTPLLPFGVTDDIPKAAVPVLQLPVFSSSVAD